MMGIGTGTGRICTSPYPFSYSIEKSRIPHIHTHTQSMREFPVKTGTSSRNTHGDGFICHLYLWLILMLYWVTHPPFFFLFQNLEPFIFIVSNKIITFSYEFKLSHPIIHMYLSLIQTHHISSIIYSSSRFKC